jgi:hypothetical protein
VSSSESALLVIALKSDDALEEPVTRRGVSLGDLVHDNKLREAGGRDESARDQPGVEMKADVVCYSGYKGDERPVRFRLSGQDYVVEELLASGMDRRKSFSKCERTTAMCTSFGAVHLRLKVSGEWNRSVT